MYSKKMFGSRRRASSRQSETEAARINVLPVGSVLERCGGRCKVTPSLRSSFAGLSREPRYEALEANALRATLTRRPAAALLGSRDKPANDDPYVGVNLRAPRVPR